MKIAVTYDNGSVFQHFGKTENFKIFEVENGAIISSEVVGSNGAGHSALAGFLADAGVDVVICGGIGGGAQAAVGVGEGLLLVVSRVEDLALLGVKGLHHALEGVGKSLPVALYVNEIVEKIALLGHGHSLSLSQ